MTQVIRDRILVWARLWCGQDRAQRTDCSALVHNYSKDLDNDWYGGVTCRMRAAVIASSLLACLSFSTLPECLIYQGLFRGVILKAKKEENKILTSPDPKRQFKKHITFLNISNIQPSPPPMSFASYFSEIIV